jgi:predicted nucleotidyltransferase
LSKSSDARGAIVVESSRRLPEEAIRLSNELLSSARREISDPTEPVENLTEKLREVLKDRVKLTFLFGSKAKGYNLKGDVDIALYLGRRPDPYDVGGLISDIQESLGREDIDVLVLDDCDNVSLAYEAIQGKPIVGEDADILQLKTKIISQYAGYIEKMSMIKSLIAKN